MTATTIIPESHASARPARSPSRAPINVLLLTSSLERGGAERQVVELAKALDPDTFRVHVCSLSNDNPLVDQLGPLRDRFTIIAKRSKYDAALILRVRRFMLANRIDVVHSFMFDAEMVGRLAGRLARVPSIICSNRCPHWQRSRHKLWVARATNGCFDRMIANSVAGMEFERDRQRVPATKLRVIPNGVDTNRYRPGPAAALRDALGIPREAVVVGMAAHFRGNKDHETWLRAADVVLRSHPSVVFLSAGSPDGDTASHYFGRARRLVRDLGIERSVRFLGPRDDMADLYRVLDVKVLSSRFEGTPNVVLEAMASGVPVIATDVSDNARIVPDGVVGFIVPTGDSEMMASRIAALVADEALRRRMGLAARQRVEQSYSVAALGRETGNVYLDVLREKNIDVVRAGAVD